MKADQKCNKRATNRRRTVRFDLLTLSSTMNVIGFEQIGSSLAIDE
jgi:hypothetical protein